MTKQELKIIHEACELIETGKEKWSCVAIRCNALRNKYDDFYKVGFLIWPNVDGTSLTRKQRILLLLLFAEVGVIE